MISDLNRRSGGRCLIEASAGLLEGWARRAYLQARPVLDWSRGTCGSGRGWWWWWSGDGEGSRRRWGVEWGTPPMAELLARVCRKRQTQLVMISVH
jgi:hypothetical protein